MQVRLSHFHPWRLFGSMPEWRLLFRPLPDGVNGYTNPDDRTVTLDIHLTQAQRRSTILHEIGHILRGTFDHGDLAEELDIERHCSRLLLPSIHDIADALVWCHGDHVEAAAELWVDEQLLHVRLSALGVTERAFMQERLAAVRLARSVEVPAPRLRVIKGGNLLALLGG